MNGPLSFSAPSLKDAAAVYEASAAACAETNELAFTNIYLLQKKYGTLLAFKEGVLYRYYSGSGRLQGYGFPIGKPDAIPAALDTVEEDAEKEGRPLSFCALTEEQVGCLSRRYGKCFTWNNDRGDADYLYRRSDLAELPGTLYHKKRNHIARFERNHPGCRFERLTEENAPDALAVAEGWLAAVQDNSPSLLHEARAIRHAVAHLAELKILGGLLYLDSQAIAMSLASPISRSIADIHYEKCLPAYRDAYPIINREMARALHPYEFLNREEDLNIPGLRQAKLSYYPCKLLSRFTGTVC